MGNWFEYCIYEAYAFLKCVLYKPMDFRAFQRCHVPRETVLQVTEGDNTTYWKWHKTRIVLHSRECLISWMRRQRCKWQWTDTFIKGIPLSSGPCRFFLANENDREPMKIQKDGLIKSGCRANCNHIHQEKTSTCLIYCNIKIGEVYHTQKVDEKSSFNEIWKFS